jgi:hypothetical protein
MSTSSGWVGFDLDGTIAKYDYWRGNDHVGEPIAPMVELVKKHLREGWEVKIFTARAYPLLAAKLEGDPDLQRAEYIRSIRPIETWSLETFGTVLPITCVKDFRMVNLYDDRAIQVKCNQGVIVE